MERVTTFTRKLQFIIFFSFRTNTVILNLHMQTHRWRDRGEVTHPLRMMSGFWWPSRTRRCGTTAGTSDEIIAGGSRSLRPSRGGGGGGGEGNHTPSSAEIATAEAQVAHFYLVIRNLQEIVTCIKKWIPHFFENIIYYACLHLYGAFSTLVVEMKLF